MNHLLDNTPDSMGPNGALTETAQTQPAEQGLSWPDLDVFLCRHSHLHVLGGPHCPGLQLTTVPGQLKAAAGRLHVPHSGRCPHGHYWNLGLTGPFQSPLKGLSLPLERFWQACPITSWSMVPSTLPPAFRQD